MAMTLEEAAARLQAAGFLTLIRENNVILGAGSATSQYEDEANFYRAMSVDGFIIEHHPHDEIWTAHIVVGQTYPCIKVDAELSNIVRAVQDFYRLCDHVSVEARDVQLLIVIGQRQLGLVIDICDAQTLCIRLPLSPTPLLSAAQMLATHRLISTDEILYSKDNVFYIRYHEARWQLELWHGSEIQFNMPLLHFDEVLPTLARFSNRPKVTIRLPRRSDLPPPISLLS